MHLRPWELPFLMNGSVNNIHAENTMRKSEVEWVGSLVMSMWTVHLLLCIWPATATI